MGSFPLWWLGVFFGLGLLVSCINSIAGGGSTLSLPVMILLGLPPTVAVMEKTTAESSCTAARVPGVTVKIGTNALTAVLTMIGLEDGELPVVVPLPTATTL